MLENHTLHSGTYPYSPYMAVAGALASTCTYISNVSALRHSEHSLAGFNLYGAEIDSSD